MIEGETRRKEIIETLVDAEKPVSASKFATVLVSAAKSL